MRNEARPAAQSARHDGDVVGSGTPPRPGAGRGPRQSIPAPWRGRGTAVEQGGQQAQASNVRPGHPAANYRGQAEPGKTTSGRVGRVAGRAVPRAAPPGAAEHSALLWGPREGRCGGASAAAARAPIGRRAAATITAAAARNGSAPKGVPKRRAERAPPGLGDARCTPPQPPPGRPYSLLHAFIPLLPSPVDLLADGHRRRANFISHSAGLCRAGPLGRRATRRDGAGR